MGLFTCYPHGGVAAEAKAERPGWQGQAVPPEKHLVSHLCRHAYDCECIGVGFRIPTSHLQMPCTRNAFSHVLGCWMYAQALWLFVTGARTRHASCKLQPKLCFLLPWYWCSDLCILRFRLLFDGGSLEIAPSAAQRCGLACLALGLPVNTKAAA